MVVESELEKITEDSSDKYKLIVTGKICPYCGCETELVTDKEIYGAESTYGGRYYRCTQNHDHYVGCHPNSKKSLGRCAGARLRQLKHSCHQEFDPLWEKESRVFKNRRSAYDWLCSMMGTKRRYTHFGMFDEEQCEKALLIIDTFKKECSDKSVN